VVLQLAVLYAHPLHEMFHTVPVTPADLLPMAAVASVVL
jgi:Ca2+-transporting ATPase